MPTPPPQRNTRSNSLNDVKQLLGVQKTEIISSFKEELNHVSSKLDTLIHRIQGVEQSISSIQKTQERQDNEINALKEALDKVTTERLSIFEEIEDRDRRKANLIVSGIPEKKEGSIQERREWDDSKINDLFQHLTTWNDDMAVSIFRIGKQRPDGNRILKIVCKDPVIKMTLLTKAKLLRTNPSFQNVYINPDQTPRQQELSKDLRMELRMRRDMGEDVVIRRGKVVRKSAFVNFH